MLRRAAASDVTAGQFNPFNSPIMPGILVRLGQLSVHSGERIGRFHLDYAAPVNGPRERVARATDVDLTGPAQQDLQGIIQDGPNRPVSVGTILDDALQILLSRAG